MNGFLLDTNVTSELIKPKLEANVVRWIEEADVDFQARFSNRILAIDDAIAERWGTLVAIAVKKGTPVPVIDGPLAATAFQHASRLLPGTPLTSSEQGFQH